MTRKVRKHFQLNDKEKSKNLQDAAKANLESNLKFYRCIVEKKADIKSMIQCHNLMKQNIKNNLK